MCIKSEMKQTLSLSFRFLMSCRDSMLLVFETVGVEGTVTGTSLTGLDGQTVIEY